ncbi:MAG: ABC transporter permease [Phycisphaerales bacterium]|jgi:peptide/nickel transport system permease protein|nr:ABC transporter permease [Phycisphaerales bacterium]
MPPSSTNQPVPAVVTGVQLMQGIGHAPAKGFWADAWSSVLKRPGAVAGLCWITVVAFFAIFSPVLASGHPIMLTTPEGRTTWPMLAALTAVDWYLLAVGLSVPAAYFAGPAAGRAARIRWLLGGLVVAGISVVIASLLRGSLDSRTPPAWLLPTRNSEVGGLMVGGAVAVLVGGVFAALPFASKLVRRLTAVVFAVVVAAGAVHLGWDRPSIERFDYVRQEAAGAKASYSVVPFSPSQRFSELSRVAPGTQLGPSQNLPAEHPAHDRSFVLGTDAFGADVLSQMLHACRLSISIGLVSTGIALLIGVTLGAIMGYFGGWVDLLLYRVVEIFMAVPVLFLLIVAAAVLPPELRTTYTMMAIIGCFTWTGMARFTRAEFLKLRNQDFVQSARSVGLPLRSVLFKHMLPNGVAPVLVDTSFAIASAITVEAVLSYLNLGPIDQASWGKLLASAVSSEGEFKWWLAVFPGIAIFLTVLSYNLVGEALRDAIDPKLKKARV